MTNIETRQFEAELRAIGDGREVTGRVCPYGEPANIGGKYQETLVAGSLVPISPGVPLHFGHPSSEPHSEADMPVSPPGEVAEDPAGMFGRWRVSRTPAGDSALDAIHRGRVTGLSVGFIPSPEDAWSPDRRAVTRHSGLLTHVALVTQGAYGSAKVLEVRDDGKASPEDAGAAEIRDLHRTVIDLKGAGFAKWLEVQHRDREMRLAETDPMGGRRTDGKQAVLELAAHWTSGAAAREYLETYRQRWA